MGMVAQFLLAEGNNHLPLHIARQNVEKAFPGAMTGASLDDFLPALDKHGIHFEEQRVRNILAANGRCD